MKDIDIKVKKVVVLEGIGILTIGLFIYGFFALSSTGAAFASAGLLFVLIIPVIALVRSIEALNANARAGRRVTAPTKQDASVIHENGTKSAREIRPIIGERETLASEQNAPLMHDKETAEASRLLEISVTLQGLAAKAAIEAARDATNRAVPSSNTLLYPYQQN